VDPLRHEVFAHITANAQLKARFNPGVTWFGWQVPPLVEVALVLVLGVALLGVAIVQFRRTD
jgi:ABC-2 type transport system permease protein